jgi:hypothetical protein
MKLDRARLHRERRELAAVFGDAVRLIQVEGFLDRWDAYGADLVYGRFTIRGTYPRDYPHSAPRIVLSEHIRSRHYYDHDGLGASLCYAFPGENEWVTGRWSLATSFGLAERFLNQFLQGLTD